MRYDKPNKVIGTKIVENMEAEELKLEKHLKVQGVDVSDFILQAVSKKGNIRITGTPIFASAIFQEGLR